ncbi:hypothetical protein BFL35_08890 [Clavibacter michiganensis]|nr:hypothetical protein BFL35_08890 [Clavibacter michiganensis]
MKTVQSSPASRIAVTVARRAAVVGVPGSTDCWRSSSRTAMLMARSTGTLRDASCSSGRSRRRRVPFVRIDSGVPEDASAAMMPGMRA